MSIRVRAKRPGFYQGARRRIGAVFTIQSEQELGTWMERVSDATPTPDAPQPEPTKKSEGKGKGKSVI
jgi:hypothetical protein